MLVSDVGYATAFIVAGGGRGDDDDDDDDDDDESNQALRRPCGWHAAIILSQVLSPLCTKPFAWWTNHLD